MCCQKGPFALGHIFNKVSRSLVEKQDAVGVQYCPGR